MLWSSSPTQVNWPCVAGQRLEQAVLGVVGVLRLVDQQVADAFAPGHHRLGIGFQQLHRQPDQVVEIDRIERGEPLLVARVQAAASRSRLLRAASAAWSGDSPAFLARLTSCLASPDRIRFAARRQQVLQLGRGVVGVEDRKPAPQAQLGVVDLQHPQAERVEGGDGESCAASPLIRFGDAFAHLRGLVGEGDRGDPSGRVAACLDQGARSSTMTRVLLLPAPASTSNGRPRQHRGALGRVQAMEGSRAIAAIVEGAAPAASLVRR